MPLLAVLELVIIILIVAFVGTQVLWPMRRGTPSFPMLRTKENQLSKDIAQLKQEVIEANLELEKRKIEATRDALKGIGRDRTKERE